MPEARKGVAKHLTKVCLLGGAVNTDAMATFPLALIPLFAVPILAISHLIVALQLRVGTTRL